MFNYTLHLVYSIITGDNSNVCTVQDLYTELIPLFKSAGMSIGTTTTVAVAATTIPINIEDINYDGNNTTEALHIICVFD